MPVSQSSRYHTMPVYTVDDKRSVIGIRPTPPPTSIAIQHVVIAGDTLETLAYRYFGSSQAWWRIADANRLHFPLDLHTGQSLTIPSSTDFGLVSRERRFR
jgi:hypothetical protein